GEGRVVGSAQKAFRQSYPSPGWVEQDPMEIWATQSGVMTEVIERAGLGTARLAAIGITNQRETTVIWEKGTGTPIYPAIVWQSRQTSELCETLKSDGLAAHIHRVTGLVIDAYFSATKIRWILDRVPGAQERAERGELLFGTVDTWLLWKLTAGRCHATDYSNASRTMLFDITRLEWDPVLLERLRIPRAMLPDVRTSSEVYGLARLGGHDVPVAGIAGDQQAALFGQACYSSGMAKNTYGTGAFLLQHTGGHPVFSENGLLTTLAWGVEGTVDYALEGSVFVAGAVVQWLRDELGLIRDAADTEYFAGKVPDTNGVYLVPAFTGLGAPYWDMYARGILTGITRGTNRDHLVRAALEAVAYQSADVLRLMADEAGAPLREVRVDGGAGANNFLMQFQADVLGVPVLRPEITETTARGAACLAGLAVGLWKNRTELAALWRLERCFEPQMEPAHRQALLEGWRQAVARARGNPSGA
ncbi:MAG: glycerol kinase GlpK, partial [Kiritimatiellae bacterium]|nr:glycerol kinase GlpK [Kiritimatiellia bacterium]